MADDNKPTPLKIKIAPQSEPSTAGPVRQASSATQLQKLIRTMVGEEFAKELEAGAK
jgi:hypothetical protein